MTGKIIKGIGGFYYISCPAGLYECRAKGIFRNHKTKPLVGDNVRIDVLDEDKKKGNITEVLPRKNTLVRPAVANVDQTLVIFAAMQPTPNLNLLDRFLLIMRSQKVDTVICFSKSDIGTEEQKKCLEDIYCKSGYSLLFISSYTNEGICELLKILQNKTTVLAGPSGVGKSSLMNLIAPHANMETGGLSEKIQRGKQTTRHTELVDIGENTFLMDTPGFSSLYLDQIEAASVKDYYNEFAENEPFCRFQGCVHINEPDCGVKDALEDGLIHRTRYENYLQIYQELKDKKKY